ncbi:MAG: hypothetical protein KDA32_07370 [Phycisphaerales bacterium]|nr:hypothetical protein [Phycisphaerales bacterium]
MGPASLIADKFATAKRAGSIITSLMRHGYHDLVIELRLDRFLPRGHRPETVAEEIRRLPQAARVRRTLEELGPTFIKIGQILSTRPDLVPQDWADEFRNLQSDLAPTPWGDMQALLKAEFGDRLDALFTRIEHEPLATASIGQVHRATLRSGEEVVIKALRPGIRETIHHDMEIFRGLAMMTDNYFAKRGYRPTEIVEQVSAELERETDLLIEAHNTERLARDFANDATVRFPRVFREASTESVLTLEYMDGVVLSRADVAMLPKETRRSFVETLTRAVFTQCLENGFFHADPHPGNLIVMQNGGVCFLDCGMTGRVDPHTAGLLADLTKSVVQGNLDEVIEASIALADSDVAATGSRGLRASVWRIIDQFRDTPLRDLRLGRMLRMFFDVLQRYELNCPADMLYLIKAISTAEGVAEQVDPTFDVIPHVRPHIERLMRRRYGIRAMRRRIERGMTGYARLIEEFPSQLRIVFGLIRQKKMTIHLEHDGIDRLTDTVDSASFNISVATLVASLIVSSSVLVLADSLDRELGWITAIAIIGYVSAGGFAMARTALALWGRIRRRM